MTLGRPYEPSETGSRETFLSLVERAAGPFNLPTDVAVSDEGDIYVSDGYGNARVHRFKADGTLRQSWGQPGKAEPGSFHVPHAVWVHTDGRVLVADRENNRVQIFDLDGKYLAQWTGLACPSDIYVDEDGICFIAELDSLVSIWSMDGTTLGSWGSPTLQGPMSGGHAIWVDSCGDLYVGQNQQANAALEVSAMLGAAGPRPSDRWGSVARARPTIGSLPDSSRASLRPPSEVSSSAWTARAIQTRALRHLTCRLSLSTALQLYGAHGRTPLQSLRGG